MGNLNIITFSWLQYQLGSELRSKQTMARRGDTSSQSATSSPLSPSTLLNVSFNWLLLRCVSLPFHSACCCNCQLLRGTYIHCRGSEWTPAYVYRRLPLWYDEAVEKLFWLAVAQPIKTLLLPASATSQSKHCYYLLVRHKQLKNLRSPEYIKYFKKFQEYGFTLIGWNLLTRRMPWLIDQSPSNPDLRTNWWNMLRKTPDPENTEWVRTMVK